MTQLVTSDQRGGHEVSGRGRGENGDGDQLVGGSTGAGRSEEISRRCRVLMDEPLRQIFSNQ